MEDTRPTPEQTPKRGLRWLGAFVFAGCAVLVFGLAGTGRFDAAEWPPINEPSALRREASALCRDAGGWRELQPNEYPPAMTRLHPSSIKVSGARVYLELVPTAQSRHRFHGYSVWQNGEITREESDGGNSGL